MDGLELGAILDCGDWRNTFNWGGMTDFTARLVDLESEASGWLVCANRNMAVKNAAFAAHAASVDALNELQAKLNK